MKRRNFIKTTGYSLGAVALLNLVSTRGYADTTSGGEALYCPKIVTHYTCKVVMPFPDGSGQDIQNQVDEYHLLTDLVMVGEPERDPEISAGVEDLITLTTVTYIIPEQAWTTGVKVYENGVQTGTVLSIEITVTETTGPGI